MKEKRHSATDNKRSAAKPPSAQRSAWRSPGVFLGLLIVLLLALFWGLAWVWYTSEQRKLSSGIEIAGVDVGGLSREQARQRIRPRLARRQRVPLDVEIDGKRWRVQPRTLGAKIDLSEMLTRAEQASPPPLARLWGQVRGKNSTSQKIAVVVRVEEKKLHAWVRKRAKQSRIAPQDADLVLAYTISMKRGRPGRALKQTRLRRDLTQALTTAPQAAPGKRRLIKARFQRLHPSVRTRADLAEKYPTFVTVSQDQFTVRVWKGLRLARSFKVATGQAAYPTPRGLFSVSNKAINPVWSVPNSEWAGELQGTTVGGGSSENPLKARWIGVTDGVGFHGTSESYSIGTRASHGCLRMHISDVKKLYPMLPVGTPVLIV